MSNILNEINKDGTVTGISSYSIDDYATRADINMIFNKNNIICDYYSRVTFEVINSTDEYIDYLFINKLSRFAEIRQIIIPEKQTDFDQIVRKFVEIKNKYLNKAIIDFINSDIEAICQIEFSADIIMATIKLCSMFATGINEKTFIYLINNHSHWILDSFFETQNTFNSNPQLFNLLFSKTFILRNVDMRLETMLEIIMSTKKTEKFSTAIIEFTEVITEYGKEVIKNANVGNALESQGITKKIYKFLKEMKLPTAYEFEDGLKNIDKLVTEWLLVNGKTYSYDIPLSSFSDVVNSDVQWETKMMSLTHSTNNITKKLEHCFESIIRNAPTSIVDIVAVTNIDTNDYFTSSRLRSLEICKTIANEQFKLYILNPEKINDYFSYTITFVKFICESIDVDQTEDGFSDDLQMLFQFTMDVFHNVEETDVLLLQSVCYGASMFTCAFIEKLLRVVYKRENRDKQYISDDWVTLGNLVDKNNDIFVNILGENHIQCLRYYLHNDGKERIGKNTRNNLAHWKRINTKDLTKDLVVNLLWLFTGVVNSLFYYYYEIKNPENIKNENL